MRSRSFSLLVLGSFGLAVTACAELPGDSPMGEEANLGESASALEIIATPVSPIPATGTATPAYKSVDDAIRRYMGERCVGGAVIGIGYKGQVLHNRGFGYKEGPPSQECGTESDPFVGGAQIQPGTPFRIGSNSKAVLAAVFRKELKKALAAKRGKAVTDADVEALALLNDEIALVSPKVRAAMLAGLGNTGGISGGFCAANGWSKVTLGHLLTHRAGLPHDNQSVNEKLSALRGLTSASALAAQEAASGATLAARNTLEAEQGTNAYFVPRATSEESIAAQGDICFKSEPGAKESYSNAGFNVLEYVLEHVTGKRFAAPNGSAGQHGASLLSNFTYNELGSLYGIERSHTALGARDVAEPEYRHWSTTQLTYYPTEKDNKRPWCTLENGSCDFGKFDANILRYNWNWLREYVGFTYSNASAFAGAGALAAEAPQLLQFMSRFAVSYPYGASRTLIDTKGAPTEHLGGLDGTRSWVFQSNGKPMAYFKLGTKRNGEWSFDLDEDTAASCTLPKGVDVFFAMNQSNDAKCTETEKCVVDDPNSSDGKTSAYTRYINVLKEALCKVDWSSLPSN